MAPSFSPSTLTDEKMISPSQTVAEDRKPPRGLELPAKQIEEEAIGLSQAVAEDRKPPRRLELKMDDEFYEVIQLLAEDEKLSKPQLIRKAIGLYARFRVEQKVGKSFLVGSVDSAGKYQIESVVNG